jgi:hypothetical protein
MKRRRKEMQEEERWGGWAKTDAHRHCTLPRTIRRCEKTSNRECTNIGSVIGRDY